MTNKIGVGPRIKQFRESKGMTREQLAEQLGVKPSTIQNIEDQRQKTSDAFIIDFISKFDVSVEWLFGASQVPRTRVELPDQEHPWSGDIRIESNDFSLIRRFGVRASAGNGIFPDPDQQDGAIAFQTTWLQKQGINANLAGIVQVAGDSMHPTLNDGAFVLVHLPEMHVKREGIYAFTRDGDVFVKRIIPLTFSDDGLLKSLVMISDNTAYPAEVLEGNQLNEIRIAGRIRCVIEQL